MAEGILLIKDGQVQSYNQKVLRAPGIIITE